MINTKKYEGPHFVLSKEKVIRKMKMVQENCDIVSYSSKTNQDVTKILEKESDCMFSVHFENELKHLEDMTRVIFLAQAWDSKTISKLINTGITWFVVDNEYDFDQLVDFLEKNEISKKINLLLRIKLREMTIKTEKYYVFGMDSEVVNKRIREIDINDKLKGKLDQIGIHFHRKTQNMSEWRLVYELSEMIDEDVLSMIDIVNIGGGLPSKYANTNDDVVPVIFDKIKELQEWLHRNNIKLMIEPGRFIAAEGVKLISHIIGIYDKVIVVDASVYNTDMDALVVPVKLLVEGESNDSDSDAVSYSVKGCTPCSLDLFRYKVLLKKPEVGDELVFLNAGAYNFMTDFCDLEKLPTKIVD